MADDIDVAASGMLTVGLLGRLAATDDLEARIVRLAGADAVRVLEGEAAEPDDAQALVRAALRLEAAGADFVVMADGAAYALVFEVERSVGIPLVSLIEEVGAAAVRWAHDGVAVGLRVEAMAEDLYRAELARRGLKIADDAEVLIVDGAAPSNSESSAIIETAEALAAQVVAYARRRRALPPPFAWTEVGPA